MASSVIVWALAVPLTAAFVAFGQGIERWAVLAAIGLMAAALAAGQGRRLALRAGAAVLVAATLALVLHFFLDHFAYRYVWLYSAPPLPWYLKLAGLWSGDEGALLLMAALAALGATGLARRRGWAGPGAIAVAAALACGAVIWSPFVQTGPDELAKAASMGMNAHLMRVWMAFHPPAIFLAYGCFLLPVGAALEALAKGGGEWREIAARWSRIGWLALSLGLATGMWWSYEDLTFGQFWHWDPVQTSIFLVWAAATAHLHTLRRYHASGYFPRLHPVLGMVAAILSLVSMAVARSPTLASSHRYVGDTSQPLLIAGAVVLVLALLGALMAGRRRPRAGATYDSGTRMVYFAALLLAATGAVAGYHLLEAYVSSYLGLPRPAELKPFFETLVRWAPGEEIAELRRAYAQWDVNNFSVNRWMAPMGIAIGFVGGHFFLPIASRRWRWAATAGSAAIVLALALVFKPFAGLYSGDGMTSGKTVAILPWLDALIGAMTFLAVAAMAWAVWRVQTKGLRRQAVAYYLPLAVLHLGAVVALVAFLAATVNDTYAQKMIRYPDDFGRTIRFPDGISVAVALADEETVSDGGPGPAFVARTSVHFSVTEGGRVVSEGTGHTVYRDAVPPGVEGQGSVRVMCEMIDYRYARFAGGKARMMHPVIHRGLWRDLQVWFPAVEYLEAPAGQPGDGLRQTTEVPLVVKTFPLVTWLWVGLSALILGALVVTVAEWRRSRR